MNTKTNPTPTSNNTTINPTSINNPLISAADIDVLSDILQRMIANLEHQCQDLTVVQDLAEQIKCMNVRRVNQIVKNRKYAEKQ